MNFLSLGHPVLTRQYDFVIDRRRDDQPLQNLRAAKRMAGANKGRSFLAEESGGSMTRRAARTLLTAVLFLSGVLLVAALFWGNAHRGFVRTTLAEIRFTPWHESLAQYRFFDYWADYYGRLALDQSTRLFTIPPGEHFGQ